MPCLTPVKHQRLQRVYSWPHILKALAELDQREAQPNGIGILPELVNAPAVKSHRGKVEITDNFSDIRNDE
jgi:hypothetical protein